METNYWTKLTNARIGRRRSLALAGGLGVGAAFLTACGGGDGTTTEETSSLVSKPVDTFKDAKRGGTLKEMTNADTISLEFGVALRGHPGAKSVGSLLRGEPGYLRAAGSEVAPSIAESWERSPDGLQVTMKLRPGVKLHNKPPVNGRTFDMDDVLFSWKRFAEKAAGRAGVVNAVNPDAPVLSLTASDPRTIVIKLKEPIVDALELFASPQHITASIAMLPKEADSTLDLRSDMIGTGPFVMTDHTPNVSFTFKRHPEYWDKDHVLIDQIDFPVVPEYATQLAQLRAGNVHFSAFVRPEDLLDVKRDEPRIQIYPSVDLLPVTRGEHNLGFGWLPDGKSAFVDERVRQAFSMSWDRDLYIDVFYNTEKFAAEGLPQQSRWHSHVWATKEGYWLDPKSKDFGPNAKYFQHDIAEGKKLMAAAGYPNGVDVTSHYPTQGTGSETRRLAEVLDGMTADVGFRVKVQHMEYATEYIPGFRDGQGQFEGWAYYGAGFNAGTVSPWNWTAVRYWPKSGVTFHGFSVNGKNDRSGDPPLTAMIDKVRIEPEAEKRRSLMFDIQRYLGKAMWGMFQPGMASGFSMAWPAHRNYGVYSSIGAGWANYREWIDQTLAPNNKS